jgi:hypothetical protein
MFPEGLTLKPGALIMASMSTTHTDTDHHARLTAALAVLTDRYTGRGYGNTRTEAALFAAEVMRFAKDDGDLLGAIAVVLGEVPGCSNCWLPATTETAGQPRCARHEHLPSDYI